MKKTLFHRLLINLDNKLCSKIKYKRQQLDNIYNEKIENSAKKEMEEFINNKHPNFVDNLTKQSLLVMNLENGNILPIAQIYHDGNIIQF